MSCLTCADLRRACWTQRLSRDDEPFRPQEQDLVKFAWEDRRGDATLRHPHVEKYENATAQAPSQSHAMSHAAGDFNRTQVMIIPGEAAVRSITRPDAQARALAELAEAAAA
jgi:hypothetical protein